MATLTSVKSGYWSDPTVWDLGVVPANGDSVTIASGHTVIFDVDQSSFTNGLAGLTINGTLKIPSQSEDPNMPNFVCLKVNANIAGTGSFLIGSPTYPITYPQSAKVMVNGTITVATFSAYGEQRTPHFDYLSQNAAAGQPNIVLTNGMPLRAGDLIAIGINGSGSDYLYTVSSYNSSTKTVTLTTNLTTARTGGSVYSCLVTLLSRQVKISKYGANSANIITGSGRTLVGVEFFGESGATLTHLLSVSASTLINCSGRATTSYSFQYSGSNVTIQDSSFATLRAILSNVTTTRQLTNSAAVNASYGAGEAGNEASSTFTISNYHQQNGSSLFFHSGNTSVTLDCVNVTLKNLSNIIQLSTYNGYIFASFNNIVVTNLSNNLISSYAGGYVHAEFSNLSYYLGVSGERNLFYVFTHIAILENITIYNNYNLYDINLATRCCYGRIIVNGLTAYGRFRLVGGEPSTGVFVFRNCTINSLASPLMTAFAGECEIVNLSINTYVRPTVYAFGFTPYDRAKKHITVRGINTATKAFEKIQNCGYIKNRWDASPPDYSTFDFYLTDTTYAAPLYLDFKVYGSSQITVSGTITQLNLGETVKVQIFSADKEPLLGDTPNFEQVYTSAGTINVSWTPPSAGEWVVRIQAEMNQTTNPVTIQNLQVGTLGGGTPTQVEPAFVFVG